MGFSPWGWILGTGVYTEDVKSEVGAITGRLQAASLLIICAVALLMYILLRASFQAEKGRQNAAAEPVHRIADEHGGRVMVLHGAVEVDLSSRHSREVALDLEKRTARTIVRR